MSTGTITSTMKQINMYADNVMTMARSKKSYGRIIKSQ
jgi:hypothetical protein